MKKWFQRNVKTIVTFSFIIPIVVVALVSISHVTEWYKLSNPYSWAIYLSVGIEIAALSSLSAISVNMGKKVYIPFIIVTILQLIGNVFFSYNYIDVNSGLFKSWVELTSPLVDFVGVDNGDVLSHKRFLALFSGGLLPIVSLSFLHMLVTLNEEKDNSVKDVVNPNTTMGPPPPIFFKENESPVLKKMREEPKTNSFPIKVENGHITSIESPEKKNKEITDVKIEDGHVTEVKTAEPSVPNDVIVPQQSQSRYSKYTYGPKRNM